MSDALVLVAFADKCLALTRDQFREALERGRELVGTTAIPPAADGDAPERLHTAEEMETLTGVKAAWYLENARRGDLRSPSSENLMARILSLSFLARTCNAVT